MSVLASSSWCGSPWRPRAVLLASAAIAPWLVGGAAAAELPLTRVVLSNVGLAEFIHEGTAAGGTTLDLPVRLDQVDDVLKSLTIFDAKGSVGPISLPGRQPVDQLFRDLTFDREALATPADLVNALVGSEVDISGPVTAHGRILKVEPEEVAGPDGRAVATRHRLSLVTDAGLVQAVFEDIKTLAFADADTRGQVERALAGLAANRARDRRDLSIGVLGDGSRPVALTYVVAAPIWKTSWRLVMPDGAGKAHLQGWAILENLTGGDWSNVDLTLVSGHPVALTQPLYASVEGQRVSIPIAGDRPVEPPSDSGRVAGVPGRAGRVCHQGGGSGRGRCRPDGEKTRIG